MMRRFKFRLLPALAAAALALSACESSDRISSPGYAAFKAPQASVVVVSLAPELLGDPMSGGAPIVNSGVFGPQGGTLRAGTHYIIIPAHTVPQGTVFVMSVSPTNYLQVGLTATSRRAPAGSNDLGSKGFSQPVELYLNYGSPPPSNYVIAWLSPTGLQSVPSRIQDTYVVGQVTHFSEYIMAEK